MVSVGSIQFQIAPRSSLHFSISTGPFRCSRCYLQGLESVALVPSEVVPFVYLASVCWSLQCLISALTQEGGGGLLFRFASSVVLRGRGGRCFPCLRCSGSRRLYMERALCCVRFQFSGTPQKRGLSCACVLCLPCLSSSGSQELDGRTLPGCSVPSPLCGPSLSFCPCQSGACALCLAATLPVDVDHPESQEVFG